MQTTSDCATLLTRVTPVTATYPSAGTPGNVGRTAPVANNRAILEPFTVFAIGAAASTVNTTTTP